MKNYKVILIVFLIGVTLFSVFKYLASLKEKHDLLQAINDVKAQVAVLESEKQNIMQDLEKEKQLQQELSEQNIKLKSVLRASEEKITKLNTGFSQVQGEIDQLNSQQALLKAENAALREEKDNLNNELMQVSARLSSLSELRKAIKELKRQVRKVKVDMDKRKTELNYIIAGNRGYVIRDGKSTYPAKIKIEVNPLPAKE